MSFLAVCAVVVLSTGCLSSRQVSRIEVNRDLYEQWPIEMRQAVLDGKVETGMTPEMVEMAIGKPTQVLNRAGPVAGTGEDMIWVYRPVTFPEDGGARSRSPRSAYDPSAGQNGRFIVSEPDSGWPPIGSTLPPSHTIVEDRTVVFRDGVVVRADPPPET